MGGMEAQVWDAFFERRNSIENPHFQKVEANKRSILSFYCLFFACFSPINRTWREHFAAPANPVTGRTLEKTLGGNPGVLVFFC